ncbi:MAG: amidohydrolase family protein [Rhizobiales bacterium]|jgi:imidazolonepropionase-like amidohydrolase|nr:amidohydrolase family protein [Hyphomicrobiales bacterium]
MQTVLRNGTMIDGTGADPIKRISLAFENGIVTQIASVDTLRPNEGDRVIDLDGQVVMPGLIDAHTHIGYHSRQPDVWIQELKESVELNTLNAAANAKTILHCGFTSIGDGGCRGFISSAVRDAISTGLIEGPRIRAAGAIICGEAGLLDSTPPWHEARTHASLGMMVNGADEVRGAVRRQVKGGVDWIKVAASGVAGSKYSGPDVDDLSYEEIRVAVEEAAKFGRKVHAHAHSVGGIRSAVRAGAISVHSAEFADQAAIEEMRDARVYFSPTIAWIHARCMPKYGAPTDPEFVEDAWNSYDAARRMIPDAVKLGATIALGSDAAHRFPHVPDAVIELEYFVALGLSPMQAIVSATSSAAEAIGCGGSIGTLQVGKAADILVIDGNPAENISILRDKARITYMWKGGGEVKLPPNRGRIGDAFDPVKTLWLDLEELVAA